MTLTTLNLTLTDVNLKRKLRVETTILSFEDAWARLHIIPYFNNICLQLFTPEMVRHHLMILKKQTDSRWPNIFAGNSWSNCRPYMRVPLLHRNAKYRPSSVAATLRGRHSQGEPLFSVSEHFINQTSVSANHYYFNQFQLLLTLWFFINPTSTQTMIIQHIFNKDSCMRIKLFVSVKDALFSSNRLLFMQYCFYHSSFYLCSIVFITPASIYTVFYSLVQLLLNKDSFIAPASIFCSVLFITPSST